MKGSKRYPYRIHIRDPELSTLLKLISKRRSVKIPNKSIAIKLGKKLRPIRKDIFIGFDERNSHSFFSLEPKLDLEFLEIGKGYDFIFKNIF